MKRYLFDYNLKNGLGHPAISLYLTGCDKLVKCKGCHNQEMQESSKEDYNIGDMILELDQLLFKFIQFHDKIYVAILGGEPLAPYNQEITLAISKHVKENYPDAIIVLYTWRGLGSNSPYSMFLEYVDYAVCGGYYSELHQENIIPSSSNQFIYDFANNEIIKPIKLKE